MGTNYRMPLIARILRVEDSLSRSYPFLPSWKAIVLRGGSIFL